MRLRPGCVQTVTVMVCLLGTIAPGGLVAREDLSKKRVVYTVPGMDAVEVHRDITYKQDNGSELKMDVYLPPTHPRGSPVPGVVLLHGGPLPPSTIPTVKDWGVFVSYGQLLAASGLVAVMFTHRFSSLDGLPTATQDIEDALRFVRDKAESFHLDRYKLCLWAFSGAGVLLTRPLHDRPDYIRCIAAYYAVFDPHYYGVFAPHAYHEGVHAAESGTVSDEVLRQFSPVSQLKAGHSPWPPLLIARAGKDHPELNRFPDVMVKEGLSANIVLDVMNHPDGQHGFDVLNDDARSREIIARTLSFMKAHLGVQ